MESTQLLRPNKKKEKKNRIQWVAGKTDERGKNPGNPATVQG